MNQSTNSSKLVSAVPQLPLIAATQHKPKKKHTKKGTGKGKSSKSKRQKNISPNGKTLSTESGSSSGPISGLVLGVEACGKDYDKSKRRANRNDDSDENSSSNNLNIMESKSAHMNLLGKRFKIEDELLGFGSFGRTYLGRDIKRDKDVAIKIMIRKKAMESFLREATVLKSVNFIKAGGFPQLLMAAYNEDICILVEELLGINLETLRKRYTKLSYATVCSIGIQLLNRLENLHKCGFIHRDIKPQNVLLGFNSNDKSSKIYLIDFGLSIQSLDENGVHYQPREKDYGTVVGTALFASINAHLGKDLSRRDDIESMIYTLIYLCAGTLPWKNINIKKKKDRHQIIMFLKEEISSNQQFQQNQDIPLEFFQILQYTHQLGFDEQPDYKYLKLLLQKIIKRNYSNIKRITDIDILNNNFEEIRKNSPNKANENGAPNGSTANGNDLVIDVSQIAFQIGAPQMGPDGGSQGQSVASNEQLVFKSEMDGRTNELREEMLTKLNPSVYRSLFMNPQDTGYNLGRPIHAIPEEDQESGSYGEEDEESGENSHEQDHDEESKGNSNSSKFMDQNSKDSSQPKSSNLDEEGDEDDDGSDLDIGDEDIPDDFEVSANFQDYALKANDNQLKEKKGNNIQQIR